MTQKFAFLDTASFETNIGAYVGELTKLDSVVGPLLGASLSQLADGRADKLALLNDLLAALEKAKVGASEPDGASAAAPTLLSALLTPSTSSAPTVSSKRWFLDKVEIEGMRGINNEGSPLTLKFKSDCVNSVSAPNGVGKSSIYDALSFALTGGIPKLDRLLSVERGKEYYVNRFHPAGVGHIKLTLAPDDGSASVWVKVTSSADGQRTVSAEPGVDGNALLADLNREFVLLDAQTFQSFIEDKALDRGRTFSGLLGLARYSALRQELQALCNTRTFNNHFETAIGKANKANADRIIVSTKSAIATDYEALVKTPIDAKLDHTTSMANCYTALSGIAVLKPHCEGRSFGDIDLDACVTSVASAEGGKDKSRHLEVLRLEEALTSALTQTPDEIGADALSALAAQRDSALETTAGEMLSELYKLTEQVMLDEAWANPARCPVCDKDDGTSVLDAVRAKLGQYDLVETTTASAAEHWQSKGWSTLETLGAKVLNEEEATRLRQLVAIGAEGTLNAAEADEVIALLKAMRERGETTSADFKEERENLEKILPPSLVAVTTAVETARRLQKNWATLEEANKLSSTEASREAILDRLKKFIDKASSNFADAESTMAADRLKKVQPVCQKMFAKIMHTPVLPVLDKPVGREELGIKLAEFWTLKDVSAQALLSESYRNAFAVSVYLAAASLYGGAPRFIVLDDVTSSFDAGHQHFLVEIVRSSFARPLTATGPQMIILSHDTLLEKLFNKHSSGAEWHHQRLEGTAQTAVLLQSGAVNKVKDSTIDLLNVGRADDAAPRIRLYVEYRLNEVIDKCRIPVPMDMAFSEDKRMAGAMLDAIEAAVKLHQKAGDLILEPTQITGLGLHTATIVGNYLSHWSSGQAQGYSAPALLGVMKAIDDFVDCFRYEPNPGDPKKFYRSLSQK